MSELIRISKVGGRYLVFEVKDVAALRREHCICAVFVGTTPQNPNQNVFSGLPIELLAEEAKLLVDKGAAFVVDDATSHLMQLPTMDPSTRQAYLQSLKTKRRFFQRAADEEKAELAKIGEKLKAENLAKKAAKKQKTSAAPAASPAESMSETERALSSVSIAVGDEASVFDAEDSIFSSSLLPSKSRPAPTGVDTLGRHITPTTSIDALANLQAHSVAVETPRAYPLYKHLNSQSYYITPGIRFGADYSVYPGDPFRYHAHFMATSFEWDEEITVLDLVTGGRLGTGVKKGFLIGGEASSNLTDQDVSKDRVRAFTIEWAAM